ncbi:tRNA pseudouridine synthase 3 like protein [Danaus plexippus plexippus]|uniref:tRNA pseudouridine synthase 3 like protein n=1 Tax=Danaus plexippus plexippus TaxID=278856 RepID=A0A212FF28_DANPL|nr:tRNA pseudouridine synthase 3 like protein [Danaus plexippus plexippus]
MSKQINKLPPKQRKTKGLSREELMNMDKNELVDRIIQLEAHTTQLKNIISKSEPVTENIQGYNNQRKFDFTKCTFRRVLLHIIYFGWDYHGLAVQEDSTHTIEHYLFNALVKSCLIESREQSQYHRCGRTDKGVSAFGQIISISLRSKLEPSSTDYSSEIQYCKILNRLFPRDIKAVAWMPIPDDRPDFSARFDCKGRQYKYYFPKSNLNITAMREACRQLIGSHDFRHLCKMDVGNGVTEFTRRVVSADIIALDKDCEQTTSMYALVIEGNAFLWHQIRCIMGVLLLVGQGHESPGIIAELLDVEANPRKPQYNMALDLPLNLFCCRYDVKSRWVYDDEELKYIITNLQADWTLYNVKSTMIKDALEHLEGVLYDLSKEGKKCDRDGEYNDVGRREMQDKEDVALEGDQDKICDIDRNLEELGEKEKEDDNNKCERDRGLKELEGKETGDRIISHAECLLQGVKPKIYTPLLKRQTCSSLQERLQYYRKKRKVESGSDDEEIK